MVSHATAVTAAKTRKVMLGKRATVVLKTAPLPTMPMRMTTLNKVTRVMRVEAPRQFLPNVRSSGLDAARPRKRNEF